MPSKIPHCPKRRSQEHRPYNTSHPCSIEPQCLPTVAQRRWAGRGVPFATPCALPLARWAVWQPRTHGCSAVMWLQTKLLDGVLPRRYRLQQLRRVTAIESRKRILRRADNCREQGDGLEGTGCTRGAARRPLTCFGSRRDSTRHATHQKPAEPAPWPPRRPRSAYLGAPQGWPCGTSSSRHLAGEACRGRLAATSTAVRSRGERRATRGCSSSLAATPVPAA
mmetsp:Transcript_29496/g.59373  ORF Transcript_29496/g.59373 Transcript_29496/m.59373 type:complete len:223 (-) Transcript_29496:544-1212(-)